MKIKVPIWLVIIVVIELLPMFIGPAVAILAPSKMPGFGDVASPTLPIYTYAIRNLAVGLGLLLALILRNPSMLFVMILVRFITDLFDLPVGLMNHAFPNQVRVLLIFFILYYIPAIFALRYLWKQIKKG